MATIYGWSYANFNTFFGWDNGVQAKYEAWENLWSRKVDAYIFTDSGASPRLINANEAAEAGDLVNEMMIQMNIYLKGESVENPLETGFYTSPGFPYFRGNPNADNGLGTGHFRVLNKYRRKYAESEVRVDSLRLGIIQDDNPFGQSGLNRSF